MAVIVISMVIVEMKEDFYSASLLSFLISVPKLFIKALLPRLIVNILHLMFTRRNGLCMAFSTTILKSTYVYYLIVNKPYLTK